MKAWLTGINSAVYPVREVTIQNLLALKDKEESQINVSDLANVVLTEPLLVFQLLRHVGSLKRSRTLTETLSVEHAILLIGFNQFFNLIANLPILEKSVPKNRVDCIVLAYSKARLSAWLIKEWLALIDEHRVEEYFVAALLYYVPYCCKSIEFSFDLNDSLDESFKKCFSLPYDIALEGFLNVSSLPKQAANLLIQSHETDRRRLALRAAIQITSRFNEGWWSRPVNSMLQNAADLLQQQVEYLWQVMVQVILYLVRHSRGGDYRLFAQSILYIPSSPIVSENEFLFLDWQDQSQEKSSITLSIRERLSSLALQLGVDRLSFFGFDSAQNLLINQYRIGFEHEDPIISQPISCGSIFFEPFCRKTQAIRVASDQLEGVFSKFKDPFFKRAAASGFAMVSLVIDGEIHGIYYIDNYISGRGISDSVYLSFKKSVISLASLSI